MKSIIILICLMLSFSLNGLNYSLLIHSSEGNDQFKAKGFDSNKDELLQILSGAFQQTPQRSVQINLKENVFSQYLDFSKSLTDSSFFCGVLAGAWEKKSGGESSILATEYKTTLTLDYLLNFIKISPAFNNIIFIVAPGKSPLPEEFLQEYSCTDFTSGKYLVVINSQSSDVQSTSLDDQLYYLRQTVYRTTKALKTSDTNKDKAISTGEWLNQFDKIAGNNKLTCKYFRIEKTTDYILLRIK